MASFLYSVPGYIRYPRNAFFFASLRISVSRMLYIFRDGWETELWILAMVRLAQVAFGGFFIKFSPFSLDDVGITQNGGRRGRRMRFPYF